MLDKNLKQAQYQHDRFCSAQHAEQHDLSPCQLVTDPNEAMNGTVALRCSGSRGYSLM